MVCFMKTYISHIYAILSIIIALSFASCVKPEREESPTPIGDETPATPEYVATFEELLLEDVKYAGYFLYSIEETINSYTFVFYAPSISVLKKYAEQYPEGIQKLTLDKSLVKDLQYSDNKYSITVTLNNDKDIKLPFKYICRTSLPEKIDTVIFRGENIVINFEVLEINEEYSESYGGGDEYDFTVTYNQDTHTGTITIIPKAENANASVPVGGQHSLHNPTVRYQTLKEITLSDIPKDVNLNGEETSFDLELKSVPKTDRILKSLSIDAPDWISTSVENSNVHVTLSKHTANASRTGRITIFGDWREFKPVSVEIEQHYIPENGHGMVPFKDWKFKEAMLKIADKNGDKDISSEEAETITEINVSGLGLTDISGIEYFKNIWKVDASDNDIKDASMLKELHKLYWLDLQNNPHMEKADISECTVYFEHLMIDLNANLILTITNNQIVADSYPGESSEMKTFLKKIESIPDNRQSTDFSFHKQLIKIKEHTKGNGNLNIVITGNGFLDIDIKDGSFSRLCHNRLESISKSEVFTYNDNWELFNVYYMNYYGINRNEFCSDERIYNSDDSDAYLELFVIISHTNMGRIWEDISKTAYDKLVPINLNDFTQFGNKLLKQYGQNYYSPEQVKYLTGSVIIFNVNICPHEPVINNTLRDSQATSINQSLNNFSDSLPFVFVYTTISGQNTLHSNSESSLYCQLSNNNGNDVLTNLKLYTETFISKGYQKIFNNPAVDDIMLIQLPE